MGKCTAAVHTFFVYNNKCVYLEDMRHNDHKWYGDMVVGCVLFYLLVKCVLYIRNNIIQHQILHWCIHIFIVHTHRVRVDEFMHRQNNFMQIFNDGNYSDNVWIMMRIEKERGAVGNYYENGSCCTRNCSTFNADAVLWVLCLC